MHALTLSLYLPSRAKLWCTLQLKGQMLGRQIHSFYFFPTLFSSVYDETFISFSPVAYHSTFLIISFSLLSYKLSTIAHGRSSIIVQLMPFLCPPAAFYSPPPLLSQQWHLVPVNICQQVPPPQLSLFPLAWHYHYKIAAS